MWYEEDVITSRPSYGGIAVNSNKKVTTGKKTLAR
jgi:hypothetical protein